MPDPISKAQEEEMSTALIAQLLAQDAYDQGGLDYYGEYGQTEDKDESFEDYSEDEFNPRNKKNSLQFKREGGVKRGRKRKTSNQETAGSDEKYENSTQSKKPRKPVSDGYNSGVYSELEEKNFLEGLDMFGRNWNKLQEHVATRDANSIRSHAQKHFIKMFRDKIPLSDKIKESGEGYTLSGKPLDPNSAAAKPYLKSISKNPGEKSKEDKADTEIKANTEVVKPDAIEVNEDRGEAEENKEETKENKEDTKENKKDAKEDSKEDKKAMLERKEAIVDTEAVKTYAEKNITEYDENEMVEKDNITTAAEKKTGQSSIIEKPITPPCESKSQENVIATEKQDLVINKG